MAAELAGTTVTALLEEAERRYAEGTVVRSADTGTEG